MNNQQFNQSVMLSIGNRQLAIGNVSELPQLATPNDVRVIIHYLKKNPRGVTLDEAADAVKRQAFEPLKVSAYESLGLTKRNGDRLQLDALGLELAQKLEPEIGGFRTMLSRIEPYRGVLNWAYQQNVDCLLYSDVANFWRESFQEAVGVCGEKTLEGYVVCFFQLCQAAALGAHINGRKGQPTRLRLDREEIESFLSITPRVNLKPLPLVEKVQNYFSFDANSAQQNFRVLISHSDNNDLTERVSSLLELTDIECNILKRKSNDSSLFAQDLLQSLRQYNSAIFILSREDFVSDNKIKEEVTVEICAALARYDGRVVLLCEAGLHLPKALDGFFVCRYENTQIGWETGFELIKTVKNFNRKKADPFVGISSDAEN
jgi:hypothetical protein